MAKSSEWDFDAPKFWDLTETDDLKRPADSWFANNTVSPASFGKQLPPLQPFFPAYKLGEKNKLFVRAKRAGIFKEASQGTQHNTTSHSTPIQNNVYLINKEIRTTSSTHSLPDSRTYADPPHTAVLQSEPNINPMTVEVGRNRDYREEEYVEHDQSTIQDERFTVEEEMEVKRKYIYMNYDRMHETIKKAKLVLEESRQKTEQWALMKKKKVA